ncbi:hypothetical protein EMPS_01295 [Entomortierella parvispora]|uniref:PLC-like phosphodiesterase n=1 Tax=Entomortierella parvispora TaxID=205924 RepID=A0A9P3LSJ7_9FUNG|nr:hypothetical protein EMPS_01295 [Entomortierella parvispora]
MRSSFTLAATTVLVASSLFMASSVEAQQLCNGYAALCSKQYSQVAYATTHNAYAFTPAGSRPALAANQDNNITTQLKDGIRALMLDAYNVPSGNPDDIELCHTSCTLFDGGLLSTTLAEIKTFMEANPNEVITIFWENAGNLTPAHFQIVYQAAGMVDYSYTQPVGNNTWPTLAEMISSGKRLVSYLDDGADASVPWLMAEYDFIFETPYAIPTGGPYLCTVDRPRDQRKSMYVLNHFVSGNLTLDGVVVDIPQPGAALQTNGAALVSHVNNCTQVFSQSASFIAVDFYEKGSVMQTVAQVNGVTFNGILPTQPTNSTSGASSTTPHMGGFSKESVAMAVAAVFMAVMAL